MITVYYDVKSLTINDVDHVMFFEKEAPKDAPLVNADFVRYDSDNLIQFGEGVFSRVITTSPRITELLTGLVPSEGDEALGLNLMFMRGAWHRLVGYLV